MTAMKWEYEVDVGTIEGEVYAANEDEAMRAACEDAYNRAPSYIDLGTWGLRQVDDD
jgi:hypothetical protein